MQDEVKKYLGAYLRAKRNYERLRRELEECETMITSIQLDYSKERVQTTPEHDKLADVIDRLSALRHRCIEQAEAMVKLMERTKAAIDEVESPTEQEMLSRRYILGQRWEQIAAEMSYSWRGIHALHSRTLKKMSRRASQ